MELKEIKAKRSELAAQIAQLVQDFTLETRYVVKKIELNQTYVDDNPLPEKTSVKISVRLILDNIHQPTV